MLGVYISTESEGVSAESAVHTYRLLALIIDYVASVSRTDDNCYGKAHLNVPARDCASSVLITRPSGETHYRIFIAVLIALIRCLLAY